LEERASYAIGVDVGKSLARSGAEIDQVALLQGLTDALEDRELAMTQAEANQAMQEFAQKVQEAQAGVQAAMLDKNREEGAAFLAENGEKSGVITTASGLQYEVIEEGDGPKPGPTDRVSVHYRGTLLDDTEFDSSYGRGTPITFGVNGVISGWTEALQLMSVGSKYRLFIPSDLAYGQGGSPPDIGPNATLIFEVELLSIE
jgi:FKBP-type peptidyl-prolyl cis-trans isomerase